VAPGRSPGHIAGGKQDRRQGDVHQPAPSKRGPGRDLPIGKLLSAAIRQFWGDVVWGDLDYLIVDLPPGTSDAALTVMQSLPLSGAVLVTSPQGLADMVVKKAAQMAAQLNVPVMGLIENMSWRASRRRLP